MNILKILSPDQIKKWDEYTIANVPITSLQLMENAADACVNWLCNKVDVHTPIVVMCGIGNNGGDGLAIARLLHQRSFDVTVYVIGNVLNASTDFLYNYKRLKDKNIHCHQVSNIDEMQLLPNAFVIDAILGISQNRPIEGLIAEVVQKINNAKLQVASIDVPTGMLIDINHLPEICIFATYTLTFEAPKLPFMFKEFCIFTGEVVVLKIGLDKVYNFNATSKYHYVEHESIRPLLVKRNKFSHKGTFGHALLIAGSYGKMGAAVLSAWGCLRTGVGLLTIAAPKIGYHILQTAVPEAMVYTIEEHEKYVSFFPKINIFKAMGIGPGIERKPVTKLMLRNLLQQQNLPPLVLDADAINMLGEIYQENPDFIIPPNTILSPHPKEFDRVAGISHDGLERHHKQIDFSVKHRCYVVLKGAHTAISTPEGNVYFNSTGNPGMATGGSGDVLTGVLLSLLAQGYTPLASALIGVYVHGLAGDMAAESIGEVGIVASDIAKHLPGALIQASKEVK